MSAVGGRKRVMIVDDAATVRAQLQTALSAEFECRTAAGASTAFDALVAEPVDAVVTDLEMPGIDGVAFLEMLRSDPRTRTLPVVVVTTVLAVHRVNACRALGCAGFVLKPVQSDYLVAKLRQLVGAPRR